MGLLSFVGKGLRNSTGGSRLRPSTIGVHTGTLGGRKAGKNKSVLEARKSPGAKHMEVETRQDASVIGTGIKVKNSKKRNGTKKVRR